MFRFSISAALMLLAGCAGFSGLESPTAKDKEKAPLTLRAVNFSDLPDWKEDDLTLALPAIKESCIRILKNDPQKPFGDIAEAGSYADWQSMCSDFLVLKDPSRTALRVFFENRFQPYEVRAGQDPEGLFTGYYEASLRGSKTAHGPYRYPIHARPDDLVMVDLGQFREELKGQRIAGRVVSGNLKPYETRAQITAGQWPHKDRVLLWLDNPADAFFVQVQGSGRVQMDDGTTMRIGYAGQNGHPYFAIGRELVRRGAMTTDQVSMQSIREWLLANPDQANDVMNTNASYVFMQVMDQSGPVGGEGVVLTPGRSLAIDRSKMPYGLPMWVDIAHPAPGEGPIRRMMMAQDTGGAIRGAVRGDVFWGYGPEAESLAGPMKSSGRYWMLLPKK